MDVTTLLARIDETRQRVDELKQRLDRSEAMVSDFKGQLMFKDEAIKALTAANSAFGDHLKTRWSVLQGLFGAVGVLLAVTFGYQVFKSEQLHRLGDSLTKQGIDIDKHVNATAQLSTALAFSLARLNNGYREAGRQEWPVARAEADAALDVLEAARKNLVELEQSLGSSAGTHPSFVDALEPAHVAALELKARASFWFEDYDTVLNISDRIAELDSGSWEAPHFKGIALGTLYPNDKDQFELEKAAYQQSIKCRPQFNRDRINLAEAYASRGYLAEAAKPVERYLEEYRGKKTTAFVVIAKAYYGLGRYVATENASALVDFENTLRDFQGRFSGNFDFSVLKNVIDNLRNPPRASSFEALSPESRTRIVRAISPLLDRS